MKNAVATILLQDPVGNIAALGFFDNYPIEDAFIKKDAALILGRSDHLWAHLAGTSQEEMTALLADHHWKTKFYYSIEDRMIPLILQHGETEWIMRTKRFVLNDPLPDTAARTEVIAIDESYAAYIYDRSDYKAYTSVEYIEDRLTRDISAGIVIDEELTAWGFTHDDGSLGFLHVREDARKRGYGTDILRALIRMRRETAKPVFCNIVPENAASLDLVKKLGFVFDRDVSWLKLK